MTGGIASGKTTVAKLFGALGIPIIDSDQIARELLVPGAPLLARLIERFGSEMLQADGSLNRAALRTVIFSDARAREALDALTHPAIREQMQRRARELGGRYQIHVIPLLIETGLRERGLDRVLLVDCPQELQIRGGSRAAMAVPGRRRRAFSRRRHRGRRASRPPTMWW